MSGSVHSWRRLFGEYLRSHKWDALVMSVSYVIKHSAVWATPLLVGLMIDLIQQPPEVAYRWLWIYGGILALVLVQMVPMSVLFVKKASKIGRGTGRRLRLEVCRQLQQLSLLYHERVGPGRLQSKLIREINFIEVFPRQFGNTALNALTVLTGTVVVVSFMAPMALLLFAVMFPMAAVVRAVFKTRLRRRARAFRQSMETMSGHFGEMIRMVPITRAHGLEREAMADARDRIDGARDRGHSYDMMTAWFNAFGFVSFSLFHRVFLVATVVMAVQGYMSAGEVVAVNGFFGAATNAVQQLLNMLPQYTQAIEGYESVAEVLDAPDIEYNARKNRVNETGGHFVFDHVTYTYPGAETPAVRNVSFEIEPNRTIAIVGPSGGGKSTALGLLLGFLRPQQGRMLYDGQDGSELDLRTFRRHISVVTQQSFMFSGTIRENVCYGREGIDDHKVRHALEEAQAWQFVQELPDGLDTRLGEEGIQLSGGQMQRIAIARALVRNPRVLVLDEPTSSLDIEGEIEVIRAIENVKRGRTTIIVSHSLSMLREADRIYIVEDGQVVDSGDHEALMSRDNFYSRASKKLAGASEIVAA